MMTAELTCRRMVNLGDDIVNATVVDTDSALHSADKPASTDLLGLIELILKRREQLDRLIRDPALQSQLVPRFLAISLIGFLFFGIAISLVLTSAGQWPRLAPVAAWLSGQTDALISFDEFLPGQTRLDRWLDGSAFKLIAAYAIGLIAATGICLPSLYFYGLLAGVRMTMLDVVVHALKSKATAAVALVGVLPIYAAFGLGIVIFNVPDAVRSVTYWVGLVLPFLAGLFGTYSLYRGFAGLTDTMAANRRCRRECFLRRLVLSWSACYTAVTPIMIYTLWIALNG